MTILVWHRDGECQKFDFDQVTMKEQYGIFVLAECAWEDNDVETDTNKIAKIEVIP